MVVDPRRHGLDGLERGRLGLLRDAARDREGAVALLAEARDLGKRGVARGGGEALSVVQMMDRMRADLGVDPAWIQEQAGEIDHVFHLAAIYDMTASDATNEQMNVGGTRHALGLAERLRAGCFHHVSSVAAGGTWSR